MLLIYAFYGYFILGLAIAVWFSFFKAAKIDPAAEGSSFWFKLIIVPGSILLWPFVLQKILSAKRSKK